MVSPHLEDPPDQRLQWLELLGTPAFVADATGHIHAWNHAACLALGWTLEQVRGPDPPFVTGPTWNALAASFGNPAMGQEWSRHDLTLTCIDGRQATARLTLLPLALAEESTPRWLVILADLRTVEQRSAEEDQLVDRALAHGQNNWLSEQVRRMAQRAEIFERILHYSPGVLLVIQYEHEWPVEYVSSNVDRFGFEREALLNGSRRFSELFHPDDLDRVRAEITYWCELPEAVDFRLEFRWVRANGDIRWMDTHLWLRRDGHGKVARLQGIAWDITDRKRSEARQRLTMHVVEVLNCPQEGSDTLQGVLQIFRDFTHVEAAGIHLHRPRGGYDLHCSGYEKAAPLDPEYCELVRHVLHGRDPRAGACVHPSEESGPGGPQLGDGITVSTGGSVWTNDCSGLACIQRENSCLRPEAASEHDLTWRSFALVPLRASGRIIGVLQLCDRRAGRFLADDIEAYESLGYSIGIALDRERASAMLRSSEERYRALFDTSRDGILMYGLDGQIEMANAAMLRMTGRPLQQLRSLRTWEFLHNVSARHPAVCQPGKLLRDGYTDDQERTVIRPDGRRITVVSSSWVVRNEAGAPVRQLEVLRDVTHEREAERKIRRLATAIEQSADSVFITDAHGRIEYVNPAFESTTGFAEELAIGMRAARLRCSSHSRGAYRELWRAIGRGEPHSGRFVLRRSDGSHRTIDNTVSPVRDTAGRITAFVAVQRDVTALTQLEMQLLQAQKLESIGRLAAGIAHEINTPSQYVGDNVSFLQDAFSDYARIMEAGRRLTEQVAATGQFGDEVEAIRGVTSEADFEYLAQEIPRAIEQSLEGLTHISHIVGAMKYFSHPGADTITPVDIHRAIESTVTVARNEWKYDADLRLDFEPSMPLVPCLPNEFNQVVLNLLVNSAHAIQAKPHRAGEKGEIVIRTRVLAREALIEIQDTGTGIPESARARVFDPFFTTKEVGRGTGQGLAIAHDVIVNRHHGRIEFETEVGVGTTFRVFLPLTENDHRVLAPEEVAW